MRGFDYHRKQPVKVLAAVLVRLRGPLVDVEFAEIAINAEFMPQQ